MWVRPLDVARLLTTRAYAATGRVVIEVDDPLGLAGGRFALDASPDGATCTTTTESAELTLPVRTLGAASLGDVRLTCCTAPGGSTSTSAGAVDRAGALLAGAVDAVVQHLVLMAYDPAGLRRIAIVNRGEAAMRLINAVRELRVERDEDIRTIALHTRGRAHGDVRARGRRGGVPRRGPPAGTYLDLDALERALRGGARRRGLGRAGASSPSARSSPSCATASASCSSARAPT